MMKVYLGTSKFCFYLMVLMWCAYYTPAFAQNGARIAATSGVADPSAMLDVVSTDKGMLVPRMTLAQKNAIINPANGLLVYQTDNSVGFYYNSGTPSVPNWVQLSAGALSGTGTTNTVTKWTSAGAIGNSSITDNGTTVTVGGTATTVSYLAGNGPRPVYADANGTLTTAPAISNKAVFVYTGSDQTYTVPAGVTSVTVKMWGAGGGGGYRGGWSNGFSGGAGGYSQGTVAVTPGATYYVVVGGGGTPGSLGIALTAYGGGGKPCTSSDCQYGAQGGGRSAFRNTTNTADLITAGGGGGGASNNGLGPGSPNRGGAGGGVTGQNGECTAVATTGGRGGGAAAGGAGGTGAQRNGTAGTQYQGGNPQPNESYGGGGGGGWYGGGGGGYTNSNTMGGGGGGSGYTGGAGVTNGVNLQGTFSSPPNMGDVDYVGGIGLGGITLYPTAIPSYGGHGLVVIIPN